MVCRFLDALDSEKKKHVSEVARKVAKSLCVCLEKAISFSTQDDVCIFQHFLCFCYAQFVTI